MFRLKGKLFLWKKKPVEKPSLSAIFSPQVAWKLFPLHCKEFFGFSTFFYTTNTYC